MTMMPSPDSTENALVKIAPLVPKDAECVSALAREIWLAHYPDIIGIEQIEYMLRQRYDPAIIRAELQRGDLWWDKLMVGDEIRAFSSYFLSDPGEMKLDKLYVRQDSQRQGYGGMLIERTCRVAQEQGCKRLALAVNKYNRNAIAAYRKHGFEVRDMTVKDIGGGFVMDDYIMVKAVRGNE